MVLYKYSSAKWGIEILRELRVRVTPPDEFNDPFEFTPAAVNPLDNPKKLSAYLKRQGVAAPVTSLRRIIPVLKKNNEGARRFGRSLADADMAARSAASKNFGVVCLCKSKDDIRMWAHYGAKHKGIALGLDFNREVSGIKGVVALEGARYRKRRARLNPMLAAGSAEWRREMENVALTKSCEWRDERECRMICRLRDFKKESRKQRGRVIVNHFLYIRPETIREVILGCLINGRDETVIRKFCERKLPHVRLTKMHRDSRLFELMPKPARSPCRIGLKATVTVQ